MVLLFEMLAVLVDGVALPDAEARAMWERFSAWMEDHRGDLAGFAKQEGFASVHPGVADGRPVLLASRAGAQRPYAPVAQTDPSPPRGGSGSNPRHGTPRGGHGRPKKPRK